MPDPRNAFGHFTGTVDSFVTLPLRAEHRSVGLVCVALRGAAPPDPATLKLAAALGQHAATTVRTAMLYEQMRAKEAELRAVMASVPDPVVVVDTDGTFVVLNSTAEALFGLSSGYERGRPVRGRLPAGLDEALLAGSGERRTVRLGAPDAHAYEVQVSGVRGDDGREAGRIMILHDRTVADRTRQMQQDFVAVIGHELRTPLTLIKGYTKTLLRRGDRLDPSSTADALARIDEQAQHLEHLIEDLLFLSRADASEAPLFCDWGDLAGFVRQQVNDAAERTAARGGPREIAFRAQTLEVPLNFDRTKVEQILSHLLDNALKYSDGRVVVEVARTGDEAVVSVQDSGIGIYSGDLPAIFDRFSQVNSTSTREHGGTGIGLYICKRLVEAHTGRIWAESQLGRGSTFSFALPLDMPARVGTTVRREAQGRPHPSGESVRS